MTAHYAGPWTEVTATVLIPGGRDDRLVDLVFDAILGATGPLGVDAHVVSRTT